MKPSEETPNNKKDTEHKNEKESLEEESDSDNDVDIDGCRLCGITFKTQQVQVTCETCV